MKKLFTLASLCIVALTLSGCDFLEDIIGGSTDQWANLVNEKKYDALVNGNTVLYGTHWYSVNGSIDYDFQTYSQRATASVSFTNIPSGYTEFEAVYTALLGKSLQGTAAMVPMAMEIYARNSTTGKRCFELLCKDSATVDGIIRILNTKFVPTSASGPDDQYIQRYLPAALLKGADFKNAYAPEEPYVVECGPAATKPQEAKMAPYGTVYYTYIFADGWDTRNRGVDIFLPLEETLYKVQGCSSCYTQCKTIFKGPWEGLK